MPGPSHSFIPAGYCSYKQACIKLSGVFALRLMGLEIGKAGEISSGWTKQSLQEAQSGGPVELCSVIFAQHHHNPRETTQSSAVWSCAKYLWSCSSNRQETSRERETLGSCLGLASLSAALRNWEWGTHQTGAPTQLLQQSIPGSHMQGRGRRLSAMWARQGTEIPKLQLNLMKESGHSFIERCRKLLGLVIFALL